MKKLADISFFESLGNSNSSMSVFNRTLAEDYVDKRGYYRGAEGTKEERAYEKFLKKNRPARSFWDRLFGKMSPEEVSRLLQELDENRVSDEALSEYLWGDPSEEDMAELNAIPDEVLHTLPLIKGIEDDQRRGFLPDDVADVLKAKYWKNRKANVKESPFRSKYLYDSLGDHYSFIGDMEEDWDTIHAIQSIIDSGSGLPEWWKRSDTPEGRDRLYDVLLELKEKYPEIYEQLRGDRIDVHRLGYLRKIRDNMLGMEYAKELLFDGENGEDEQRQSIVWM